MSASQGSSGDRGALRYLTAFFATSHVDRHIIAIAMPSIGLEFALNDIELGILSGIAFSLVFAVAAIPLGMITAFMDRRNVIAASIICWSAFTALSGFAAGFWSLLALRLGIGIAESAGVPAAHRVVSETFSDTSRISAFSVFHAGASIGIALALIGGGILVQVHGWRTAMIVAGLPGLVLGVLAYRYIPPSARYETNARLSAAKLVRESFRAIMDHRAKRLVFLGVVLTSIISHGMLAWLPSALIRVHGMETRDAGLYMAIVFGVFTTIGTIAGGRVVTRMSRSDPAWTIWLPMLILLTGKPLIFGAMLSTSPPVAMGLLVFPLMFGVLHFVTSLSILHEGLSGQQRLMVSAVLLMSGNFIGYTLGPLIVGVASWTFGAMSPGFDGLGYAIIVLQVLSVPGLVYYWFAGFAYRDSAA